MCESGCSSSAGSLRKLRELARNQFEPLYGYPLSDADIDGIIENLTAYGRVLNEINNSIVAPTRPIQIPATFPQSAQVRTGRIQHSLPQSGQPE